jgi:hypothetical protein
MTRLRRIKPSPALVVASLALLVALGGTSVAAVAVAIPRGSVGTIQLKDNAVISSKVKNGTLLRTDFRSGQIPKGATGARGAQGPAGPVGPAGPAGPAGAAGVASPGYVAEVVTQTGTGTVETTETSYANLPDGSVNVNVPTGETARLVAFFSAETSCYGGTTLRHCLLRITVDGNELSPAAGNDANFDNNDLGSKNSSAVFNAKTSGDLFQHSIVRTSGNLSAGSHTVRVQYSSENSSTAFRVDDWALVVQRIKVS